MWQFNQDAQQMPSEDLVDALLDLRCLQEGNYKVKRIGDSLVEIAYGYKREQTFMQPGQVYSYALRGWLNRKLAYLSGEINRIRAEWQGAEQASLQRLRDFIERLP